MITYTELCADGIPRACGTAILTHQTNNKQVNKIVHGPSSTLYIVLNIPWTFIAETHGSVVVNELCYKPEGRGFDTDGVIFLNLPNPSGSTRPWGILSL
jgi:hypothetical protein